MEHQILSTNGLPQLLNPVVYFCSYTFCLFVPIVCSNFHCNSGFEKDRILYQTFHYKYGNTKHIEEVFEKHRLEKVPKNQTVYCDEIKEEIFVLGQEIFIPKCIRDYFRGIEELDDKIRKSFRNCSRLYNKSTIIGMNESSLQIALLVASVESLAKTEGISFSQFVQKYCETAKKCDIDDMYEIRSKLFHSGEFSFLEFEISMNPYLNPVYEYLSDKYDEYRKIVRKALISWIKHNILTK